MQLTSHLSTAALPLTDALALWGGLECTVVRLGERFRNQIQETGHDQRLEDLDRIAALGIRTLRYPVLLETVAPLHPDDCDWRWHDERLARLRALGITPIAGLMHHGSGPVYAPMDQPEFAPVLARHAERVAQRYPWVIHFTPVNEPLTTARFSGLYGHWYPHGQSKACFLRLLVNQCRAVVLSMQAIRRVTPQAQLVQTEDLGKTFGTPPLQAQIDHENSRRWLSFDLLCGRVDSQHEWWPEFMEAGIGREELAFFQEAGCTPDLLGLNHYLTSERYVDHRLNLYPSMAGQHNGRYVDLEAVRMDLPESQLGPEARLREVWQRYGLPMAVTEVHHGCSRDDQLRWLLEVWRAAQRLRAERVDLRAVTLWSLLGAVDWNTLLTQDNGFYEPGAFDVRAHPPRLTVLGQAAHGLATTGDFAHPVLDRPGWWQREERFYKARPRTARLRVMGSPQRLTITGATGTLGQACARICNLRGLDHDLLSRQHMDIADPASVQAALLSLRPWAVVNTAGYVRVAEAEHESAQCFRENAQGAVLLARACAELGIPYVCFSSDLVFSGRLGRPYRESDVVDPRNIYGRSKAEAEQHILAHCPQALVVRTSAFFGPWDEYNFAHATLSSLARGQAVFASAAAVSPTYVPDLAHAMLDLLIDGAQGLWHLSNQGALSWHEFAHMLARSAGLDHGAIEHLGDHAHGLVPNTALVSERGQLMPSLALGVERYLHDSRQRWRAAGVG